MDKQSTRAEELHRRESAVWRDHLALCDPVGRPAGVTGTMESTVNRFERQQIIEIIENSSSTTAEVMLRVRSCWASHIGQNDSDDNQRVTRILIGELLPQQANGEQEEASGRRYFGNPSRSIDRHIRPLRF